MSVSSEQNYYEVLEVPPDAPQYKIHEAFQRAKKTYSTDSMALYSMFSQEEAKELLKLIEEAFSVLGNQSLRQAYDEKLKMLKDGMLSSQNTILAREAENESWDSPAPEISLTDVPDPSIMTDTLTESCPQPEADFSLQASSDELAKHTTASSTGHWDNQADIDPSPEHETSSSDLLRTPLSAYVPEPDMEEEIENQECFSGEFLRRVREYKNITTGQMSEHIRVSRTYLEAIETDNFQDLPAPVFVRGFIIQIAKVLGLSQEKCSKYYVQQLKDSLKK